MFTIIESTDLGSSSDDNDMFTLTPDFCFGKCAARPESFFQKENMFGHASHEKIYSDRKTSVHWSGARNEDRSASRLWITYQAQVNRLFHLPIDSHRILFVCASDKTSRTILFDALGSKRECCILGESISRHSFLPGPASPRRRALRRSEPFRL